MDTNYYNYFINEMGLQPTDITLSASKHQDILCLECNKVFNATPKSKVQNFKKYSAKGCPSCTTKTKYKAVNETNIIKLSKKFEILSDWGTNNDVQLTVRNKACDHIFTSRRGDLIDADVNCPICSKNKFRELTIQRNKEPKEFTLRGVTKEVFLQRLGERNVKYSDRPVYFVPDQEYIKQESKYKFTCKLGHAWIAKGLNVIYNGHGCSECKVIDHVARLTKPLKQLLLDFEQVHGDRYTYPNIENEYVNAQSIITVNCKDHGNFTLVVKDHINAKHGCAKCAIDATRLTQEEFEQRSNVIHNNFYDYVKTVYKTSASTEEGKVIITCPVHGDFIQFASSHLQGFGCAKCSPVGYSKKAIKWLEFVAWNEGIIIQHADTVEGEYCIPNTKYKVDGFCVETNTIYEFHGDAFHGNPNRYAPDFPCHPFEPDKPAIYWYERTMKREEKLKSLGYNLVTIWESDFDSLDIDL